MARQENSSQARTLSSPELAEIAVEWVVEVASGRIIRREHSPAAEASAADISTKDEFVAKAAGVRKAA